MDSCNSAQAENLLALKTCCSGSVSVGNISNTQCWLRRRISELSSERVEL